MGLKEDLTGKTFGYLYVINRVENDRFGHSRWYCKCLKCGNTKIVKSEYLIHGITKSCGCLFLETVTVHGLSANRAANSYYSLCSRCYNKNDKDYSDYGGRDIGVCTNWRDPNRIPEGKTIDVEGLKEFVRWSYEEGGFYDQPKDTPFKERLTIERKDPNGNYCPENCEWIPQYRQSRNRRNVKQYIYDGEETLTYGEFEWKYNINPGIIHSRKSSNYSDDAIVYQAKHSELNIRYNKHATYPYVNKDGFGVLIPTINNKFFKERENKNNTWKWELVINYNYSDIRLMSE